MVKTGGGGRRKMKSKPKAVVLFWPPRVELFERGRIRSIQYIIKSMVGVFIEM